MLQDFQNIFVFDLTFERIISALVVSLVCGFIVSVFYKLSYKGTSYPGTMMSSLIALSMITSVVIMVIGNNLARAFGLVGAMSIIRFRTAIKDTQDIVFIFFALAVGMASGVEFYGLAFVGSVFIGFVMYVLSKISYGIPRRKDLVVQFVLGSKISDDSYLKIFDEFCEKYQPVDIKSSGDVLRLSYFVRLKRRDKAMDFVQKLRSIDGISQVNIFFEEGEF